MSVCGTRIAACVALLSGVTPAGARPALLRGRTIVLVSTGESPPAEVGRLAESLARRLHGPDAESLASSLERAFPRPTPPGWDPGPLRSRIAASREDYFAGRFDEAGRGFAELRVEARDRIDRIGADAGLARAVFASQMLHAIALVRTGKRPDAKEVVLEAHALFPDERPGVTEFGPEVVALFEQALEDAPTGQATIRVEATGAGAEARSGAGAGCTVRRNGREVGEAPVVIEGAPGTDVVLSAKCGASASRLRRGSFRRGTQTIRIDVAADAALETGSWVGLRSAGRRADLRAAAAVGGSVGAANVALLRVSGSRVEGVLVRIDGPSRWRVVAEGDAAAGDREVTERLGDLLAAAASSGDAEEGEAGADAAFGSSKAGRGAIWWISAGAGALVGAAGALLYATGRGNAIDALESDDGLVRRDREDSARTGLTVGAFLVPAGIGAVLAGAALYFLPADGRGTFRGPLYAALLVGGAVLAGIGVTLLAIDGCEPFDTLCTAQGPDPGPSTFALGLGAVALGAAATGAAVTLRLTDEGAQ